MHADGASYKFSFSLDIPVSSYRGKHFKKLLLHAVANRVNMINQNKMSTLYLKRSPCCKRLGMITSQRNRSSLESTKFVKEIYFFKQ